MDGHITEFTDEFIEKVKKTEDYEAFHNQSLMIKNFPDLYRRINEYRSENFEIQSRYEGDELFDRLDEFEQRNESFLEDPRVYAFLQAEAGFARMMQEIIDYIMEGLEFQ